MSSLNYKPYYFDPREFISPAIYAVCGDDALNMIDPDVLAGADELRNQFGPMVGNTWWNKKLIKKYGLHRFRGLRPPKCKIGAKKSAHKIGIKKPFIYSALDLWPLKMSATKIRKEILNNTPFWITYFNRMEVNIPWLHIDSKNKPTSQDQKMRLFKP